MGEKTKLQEMLEKKEKIRQGGGEKKVAKQHGAGKLTARERIDLLFDPGTFQEYNIFMKHRCHDFGMEKVDTPAEGVVTGYGLIHGAVLADADNLYPHVFINIHNISECACLSCTSRRIVLRIKIKYYLFSFKIRKLHHISVFVRKIEFRSFITYIKHLYFLPFIL